MSYKTCSLCKREFKNEEDFLSNTNRWRVCDLGMLWFNCECNSTLVIPKGKFDWYSPEKIMSPAAGKVFNNLHMLKSNFPLMPSAAMEAQSLLQDERTSIGEISESIRKMPVIAIEIIKTADSLRIGRNKIENLEHACVYVGRDKISELINLACVKSFKFNSKEYQEDKFWQESLLTGLVAEQLAIRFLGTEQKDFAYLAGSFANIGKIILAILLPEKADDIHRQVSMPKETNTWAAAEKELNIVDHTILGEIACRMWGIPDYIVYPVINHHGFSQNYKSNPGPFIDIVTLSNQIMHWISLNPSRIDLSLMVSSSKKLGIDAKGLEKFCDEVMPLADKASELAAVAA